MDPMLSGLQATLIILIFLVIITQTVSVRIRYDKRLILDFNLTIFSFSITPQKGKKRNRSKRQRLGISEVLRIIKYGLSRSHITITSFPGAPPDSADPLLYGYTEILRSIALLYLEKSAASASYSTAEPNKYGLDVTVDISFYHLVSTLFLYLGACRKSKRKARTRL